MICTKLRLGSRASGCVFFVKGMETRQRVVCVSPETIGDSLGDRKPKGTERFDGQLHVDPGER